MQAAQSQARHVDLLGLHPKFVEVGAGGTFDTAVWRPLLQSNYYKILAKAEIEYEQATPAERKANVENSFESAFGIKVAEVMCGGTQQTPSCRRGFTEYATCDGAWKPSPAGQHHSQALKPFPAVLDADEISVHLWTYSMAGGQGKLSDSFYKILNNAVPCPGHAPAVTLDHVRHQSLDQAPPRPTGRDFVPRHPHH